MVSVSDMNPRVSYQKVVRRKSLVYNPLHIFCRFRQRSPMRVKRHTGEWAILAIAVVAMGILAGAAPESSPRLVSVQPLPEEMAACTWEQYNGADPNLIASLQQENLFSSLEQDSSATLMAALQQGQQGQRGQRGQRGAVQQDGEGGGTFELPTTERQDRKSVVEGKSV